MTTEQPQEQRSIETEIEIDAPVEAVWQALTDAEHLANWFPLKARVKPGVGGSVWSWFSEDQQWEVPIDIWEPNRHLRLVWARPGESEGFSVPFELGVDYHLDTRGGSTILRLVQYGFSTDSSWDAQYDGTVRGWDFQLRGLKHYLERHHGTKRVVVDVRQKIDGTLHETWARLMSPEGLVADGSLDDAKPGDKLAITTCAGDRFEGPILAFDPPRDLIAFVDNMNNAYLWVRVEEPCWTQPEPEAHVFLATYGLEPERVAELEANFTGILKSLFAPVSS